MLQTLHTKIATNRISTKHFIIIIIPIIIGCIYIISHYYTISLPIIRFSKTNKQHFQLKDDHSDGWISSILYNELKSYITSRENIRSHIKKPFHIQKGNVKVLPLNNDYIQFIKNTTKIIHPYSTWKCSNTSNTDYENSGEYCILTNIYYDSALDQYYFYQDPSQINKIKQRYKFMAPYHAVELTMINDMTLFEQQSRISAILTQPTLVAAPPDSNYAHGFLELCGPRFWVLAECQYHASYVNPSKIQIYYTSELLKNHVPNWGMYQRRSDGTYEPRRQWEYMIQSMFSIYSLLTYKSFNDTTVMFKYMIFPGIKMSRSASWGYTYLARKYRSYPMSTEHYRRAYLAYSEWIIYNFNLKSKFELTKIQNELQEKKISEQIPICNHTCVNIQQSNMSIDEYTGEWIVVLNRAGVGRREIKNAGELVEALLKTFPDHSNPYLRVWPKQFNFNDNLYETVRMARSIRIIIGVHGAGLSNTIFMRPGAILYEIDPYGCRDLSFNFRRWAEVFNLQHALWIPSVGEAGNQDDVCNREGATTVNTKEIIDEVKNLLKNEILYRNGYIKRALDIMNDMSVVDYPPTGFENIFS